MASSAKSAVARAEILAIAGPEALMPPIEDPHDPRWDMGLGGKQTDYFKDFVPTKASFIDPVKELAGSGITTPRDLSLLGISRLVHFPGLGVRSIMNCWSNMRQAEPPMPLPFKPNLASIVQLSLGELERVPAVVATQQWLPEEAHRRYGRITVARAQEMISETPHLLPVPDSAEQRFVRAISQFGQAFMQERARQGMQ